MQPVVELKARIVQIRNVERGETVGYGGTWTARRPTRLAIVAAGYADGYFRAASANDGTRGAEVVVAGKRCPIAGRVSMDLMAVDVTDLDKNAARRGHMVTLIGEGITVDELAHHFGTIGYEVLTSLGRRFARVYKGGEAKVEPPAPVAATPVAAEPAHRRTRHRRPCHRRPRPPTRHEDRDLQHQQHQPPAAQPVALAARGKARRRGLQELKAADAEFPIAAIEKAGYGAVWRGQKTWNGVAILARNAEPVLIRDRPARRSPAISEARYIEAAVRGIIVTSIYLPNGNPQPGPKFDYKLAWFKRLRTHAAKIHQAGHPGRARRRLQRRADASRHLSDALLGQGRADPAEEPRGIRVAGRAGLDGCDPRAASAKADVHLLGLHAQPLAARCGTAARPSPAQPGAGAAPGKGRRRPQDPRRGRRQRPRAGWMVLKSLLDGDIRA